MRASLPVKLAFNATGRAASRGGIIRAGIVVVMSAALVVAVMAGLLSFLSPCVLPLVPAYLGYLSGQTFRNT